MAITTNVPSNNFEDLQRDVQDATRFANATAPFTNRVGQSITPIPVRDSQLAAKVAEATSAVEALGWFPVDGSFADGGTITARNQVLFNDADSSFYSWSGVLPKVVPAASTPAGAGGISANAWVNRGDSALRSALAATDSVVLVGGVEAKDLFNYPKAYALGIRSNNSDVTNGNILQNAINTYGGIELDLDFSYSLANGLLLPAGGAKIYSQKKQRTITWTGPDAVWAVSTNLPGGTYRNHFENWTLTGAATKKLFDAARVRESEFKNFNMIDGLIGCRIRSSWYTKWVNCRFANGAAVANSKGLYFEFDGAEPFNVVNLADFESCQFDSNYDGIVMETGGEGVVFRNCGIEVNKRGIVFQGQGGGRSVLFCGGCYVEGNELGNIVWNKTGAGEFQSVVFEDNYFGTEDTARSGIIEFVASNGGNHYLTFRRNKMRDFGGLPSQNVLLDVNGASMAGIFIDWFNNGEGANVPAFNRNAVNWRYMKTDVVVKLAYATNPTTGAPFEPAYSKGDIFVSTPEFGQAVVWGTFKSTGNSFLGPLNVTESMPATLQPAALEKCIGATVTDANAESTAVTVMVNGGQIRTTNLADKVVSFSHRYSLEVDKRAVI